VEVLWRRMAPNVQIEKHLGQPAHKQEIEIVERKGIGHPDTLCDGIAEAISRELSKEYLSRFGGILHHNTDAVQISGGVASVEFGGGGIIEPMYVLIGGQATKEFEGDRIPVDTIAIRTAREYLRDTVPNLDMESHVVIDTRIDEGTTEFKQTINLDSLSDANDTSYGVGYAPLSEAEELVRDVERGLFTEFRERHDAVGEDMKFMAKREGDEIDLTVAMATVSKYVPDIDAYASIRDEAITFLREEINRSTEMDVNLQFNVLDDLDAGSVFLTETGSVAEAGDDAAVGRGNRVNGLITPGREMSLDAASGKNPANHVGKLYNLLATELAEEIHENTNCVTFVQIKLVSQIGSPINDPHVASVQLETGKTDEAAIYDEVEEIVADGLDSIPDLVDRIISDEVQTY